MKKITLFIGIMLALMLCISPVGALSADDFEINIDEVDGKPYTYTYSNVNNPVEKYTKIHVFGTLWMHSLATFKPANIEGAPVMVVDTYRKNPYIYLPKCVDNWEIKYYSCLSECPTITNKYLKNAGVVNLNKRFKEYIRYGLYLGLSLDQCIYDVEGPDGFNKWSIPEVYINIYIYK